MRFLRSTLRQSRFLAIDLAPESFGFDDRSVRLIGEIRRDFHTDETVGAARRFINRPQDVGGMFNVLDSEAFVELGGVAVPLRQHAAYAAVVFVGAGDGLLKNRRVRRYAA
jgi:hypothetical protein